MSLFSKQTVTAIFLAIATQAQADVSTIGFTAEVGELNEKGEVPLFTDKYNGYDSAHVFFNALLVKITINKKQPDCNSLQICQASATAPEVIYFDVKRVERLGCYDSYVAKKRDIHNDQIVEKIIIQRLANGTNERCQNIKSLPQGSIHYRVIGLNEETQELGWAHVFAKLLNLKALKK
ncbi:MAG: hypothetical protein ACK5V3_05105 [Bdellovibrionales bacterium]